MEFVQPGGDPIIAVYERTETGLQRRTFNTAQLAQSFDGYQEAGTANSL